MESCVTDRSGGVSVVPWQRVVAMFVLFAVLLSTTRSSATVVYHPVVPPSHLKAGTQYFEANPSGFREYLDSIQQGQPQLYHALDADVATLESNRTLGLALLIGGPIVGGLVMLSGLFLMEDCSSNHEIPSDAWDRCQDANLSRFLTLFAIGAVIIGGAAITGAVVIPGRTDLLRVVNKHNQLSPQIPIDLQLGYQPKTRVARAGLILRF